MKPQPRGPDGRQLAFGSNRRGTMDVYVKPVVGPGSEELLVAIEGASDVPSDWSPDGQFLLFSTGDKDIWALPMRGDRKPFPVVQAPFDELNGQFSPDGRWIAYQSNESGRFEIYVQRFPGPGPKTLVCRAVEATRSAGGTTARRSSILPPDNGLMAVPIRLDESGDRAEVGAPALLFKPELEWFATLFDRATLHGVARRPAFSHGHAQRGHAADHGRHELESKALIIEVGAPAKNGDERCAHWKMAALSELGERILRAA